MEKKRLATKGTKGTKVRKILCLLCLLWLIPLSQAQSTFTLEQVFAKMDQVAMLVADTLRHRGWQGTLRPCSPACPAGRS